MKSQKTALFVLGALAVVVIGFVFGSRAYKERETRELEAKVQSAVSEKLIRDHSPILGPAMARVTIVEFLDPECESCRAMYPLVKSVLARYPGARLVVRYMPLHTNSQYAAALLEATREKDKYWEALELAFRDQPQWGDHHNPKPELLLKTLGTLGFSKAELEAAVDNPQIRQRIQQDQQDGRDLGVRGTPTFFVNGKMLAELGEAPLRQAVEEALKETN